MARFYGKIGFAQSVIDAYGVATECVEERPYYGDILHSTIRNEAGAKVVGDTTVNNQISVVGDEYFTKNFSNIRYVSCWGAKWKVTSIEPQYPRMILQIGGVWNG